MPMRNDGVSHISEKNDDNLVQKIKNKKCLNENMET